MADLSFIQQANILKQWQDQQAGMLVHELHVELITCLYWHHDKDINIGPDRRLGDTFIYIPVKGGFKACVEQKEKIIYPGEFLLVTAGCSHEVTLLREKALDVVAIHCHITRGYSAINVKVFPIPFIALPNTDYWHKQFRWLIHLFNQNKRQGQIYGEMLLKILFSQIIFEGNELIWSANLIDPRVSKGLDFIHSQYSTNLSVEDIASKVGLSSSRFRRIFYRDIKTTVQKYLSQYRLKMAADFLIKTGLTIKETAFQAGFSDSQYFHNCFKKNYGVTPTQYRNYSITEKEATAD